MFKVIRSESINDLAAVLQSFEESVEIQGFSFSVETKTKWDLLHNPREISVYVCLVQYRDRVDFNFGSIFRSENGSNSGSEISVEKSVGCDEPVKGIPFRPAVKGPI